MGRKGEMSKPYCLTLLAIYYVTHDYNWSGGGVLLICFKHDTTNYLRTVPAETHKHSCIEVSHTVFNYLNLTHASAFMGHFLGNDDDLALVIFRANPPYT